MQVKYKNGFTYTEHENEIDRPLSWKKPRKIFVNSMSDLFHEKATDQFINAIFNTMMIANQHTYQILTKRPKRMKEFTTKWLIDHNLKELPTHIWLGVSVEDSERLWRITTLKEIKCIRFVSFEPLLGIIEPNLEGIHWAIVGGESGKGYRQVKNEWVLILKEYCRKYGVPFFFKQWGGITPKANGRMLDGKTYDEYPTIQV